MDFFFYLDRDSFVHRLDGLTKLAVLGATCGVALASHRVAALAVLVAMTLAHLAVAGCLSNLRRVGRFLAVVTAVTTVLWAVAGRGATPLFLWVTREGLAAGVTAALRIDTFVLAGTVFLSTTRNEELLQALVRLRVPYPLCFAFSTALRLAPAFVGLGLSVREAQRARGLDPDAGSPLARLRKNVPVLVPAFLSTLRTTSQLAMSLEARGFGLGPRTFLSESRPGRRDAVVLALLAGGVAAALWL